MSYLDNLICGRIRAYHPRYSDIQLSHTPNDVSGKHYMKLTSEKNNFSFSFTLGEQIYYSLIKDHMGMAELMATIEKELT